MFRRIASSLIALVLLIGIAAAPSADEADELRLIGVLMYADWCGSCKVLDPKLQEIKTDFEGQGVLFTRFDLTDDFTTEQSRLLAELMGLDEVFARHARRTGYMVLINAASREEIARITFRMSKDEIRQSIAEAAADVKG